MAKPDKGCTETVASEREGWEANEKAIFGKDAGEDREEPNAQESLEEEKRSNEHER